MRVRGYGGSVLILALLGLLVGCEDGGEPPREERSPEAPVIRRQALRTRTLTFPVTADAWVEEAAPTASHGADTHLNVRPTLRTESFLRFDVSGLGGDTVRRATLRLYTVKASSDGPEVHTTSTAWTETGLTWNNRPAWGSVVGDMGALVQDAWVAVDATAVVRTEGPVAFVLRNIVGSEVRFLSREAGRQAAQLVLEVEEETEDTTLRFSAEADAHVQQTRPKAKLGNAVSLEINGLPPSEAYLRFHPRGFTRRVTSAKLRLFSKSPTSLGPELYATATDWDEPSLTWLSRPERRGPAVAALDEVASGEWVELDVTPLVRGEGVLSLALVPRSADGVDFSSREAVLNTPELVVTLEGSEPLPAESTRVLEAVVDGYTDSSSQYGTYNTTELRVAASHPWRTSYLRFDLSGSRGDVASAKLRLFVLQGAPRGPDVWTLANHWSETWLSADSAPSLESGPVARSGAAVEGTWLELDVTGAFLGGPLVSLALVSGGEGEAIFASSEHPNVFSRPQLVVTTRCPRCSPGGDDPPATGTPSLRHSWGGPGAQSGQGVAVDAWGNQLLLAEYDGAVDFGGGTLPNHGTGTLADSDLALIKLRSDGGHVWSRGFGAPGTWMRAVDVAVDASGHIAVVGRSSAGVDLGSGWLAPGAFVALFSPEGALLWAHAVEGRLQSVAFDRAGHVLTAGDGVDAGTPPGSRSNVLLVVQRDARNGAPLWSQRIRSSDMVLGETIAVGPSNEVVVGGSYRGKVAFGTTVLDHAAEAPFLVKFSSRGTLAWARGFTVSGQGYHQRSLLDVAVAADGAIAGVGVFTDWMTLGSQTGHSSAQYAGFLAVMEPDGSDRWWRWMGNGDSTFTTDVAIDAAGDLVVMGGFGNTLDLGGGPLTTVNVSSEHPGSGFFVAKYRMACGEHRWSRQFSQGADGWGQGIAVAPGRGISVAGGYLKTFGAGFPADADQSYRAMLLQLAP